ncbi:hypothetical protein EON65_22580 [archaeon]|nr:MAG: hypothetical protein EON65_22580 [archaeon]
MEELKESPEKVLKTSDLECDEVQVAEDVDGKHQWQNETDSPLPRREQTVRSDYNVLKRANRIYLTNNGWMFEQDNKKVSRTDAGDKLIAQEKGLEEFVKIDASVFNVAQKWWAGQEVFWKNVRGIWDGVFTQNDTIKFKAKVENKALYEHLFAMAERSVKENWDAAKSKKEAETVIHSYLDMQTTKAK